MKIFQLILLFVLLFGLLGVVSAQESDAPTGENSEVLLDEAANDSFSFDIPATSYKDRIGVFAEILFRLIYNLAYLPVAAPLVQALVQLSKRFTSEKINPKLLSLLFTVLVFGIWVAANEIGYGGQFESVLAGLGTIGISLLGITLSTAGSGKIYDFAKAQKIPMLGYARSA
jgi:small-conductance mechanosensitive channel